jgi:hypothetical protein
MNAQKVGEQANRLMATLRQSQKRKLDEREGTICKQWWRRLTLDDDFMTSCKATMRSSSVVIMLEGFVMITREGLIRTDANQRRASNKLWSSAGHPVSASAQAWSSCRVLRGPNNRLKTQHRV